MAAYRVPIRNTRHKLHQGKTLHALEVIVQILEVHPQN